MLLKIILSFFSRNLGKKMTSNPKSISLFRNNNDYIGRDFPKAAHLEIRPHPPEKRLVVVHYCLVVALMSLLLSILSKLYEHHRKET